MYEGVKGQPVTKSQKTNEPALPSNFNYVQFGKPTQVYVIGGGDFEHVTAASLKSCLKLVKKNNVFTFESLAELKYARNGHSVCNVSDTHLVVTGTRIGKATTCEIYNI